MAMLFGPTRQINAIIKPELKDTSVSDFLLDHIKVNIADLQKSLNRSADDVILLMHMVINNMRNETIVPTSVARLSTQADRFTWEQTVFAEILNPILGNVARCLEEWYPRLATDKRLGADRLMCLIYETDRSQDVEDTNQLLDIPRMWRFRTPITIEHMARELESKCQDGNNSYFILQNFLHEDCLLQALRYIPNILRLQRALLQKYQKKLDKTEANAIKVKDLKKERVAGHDTDRWIHDFACAWEITRKSLEQYGCPTQFGLMFVPKVFCNQTIHDETPLALFLPSTSGAGLCSYAMLDCLFRKQNDFLHNFALKSGKQDIDQSIVKPMSVTSAHLISYDHEQDLMPLVLANCQYSVEMGVGTKIEYDFAGIERQLIDRFICSKSRIELTCFLEIDQMVYRSEVTTHSVLKELSEKIPQVHLLGSVRTQICEELRRQPDVCRSLDNLDIAISFLKTSGGNPTERLDTFMTNKLKLENAMLSQKARQSCELQHTRSLWLLLLLQKSKLQIEQRQTTEGVFETLQHNMVANLDGDVKKCFNDYLTTLSVDKLSIILDVMHEFLLLNVSIRQNIYDEDYIDTSSYSFLDGLREYIAASEPQLVIDDATLDGFPPKVLYKHGANAWVLAYEMLKKKIENKRRH
ncbi:E3 ubiquitin-protein ligase RNF213-like [Dreissena polymorpha]|nr:E3 ubiquitin-protein ligase RNF213-like [Dreissena polymorpha]